MTNVELDFEVIVPGTADAQGKGCICPGADAESASGHAVLLLCGGLLFAASCPVHRHAVQAEVQRMFGRPQ